MGLAPSRASVTSGLGAERGQHERPMLDGERAYLHLGQGLQWVRQHVDAQARPPRVCCHGVGERFELLRHDDDRRRTPLRDRDRVVDAPRGARASVPETHERDIHASREVFEPGGRGLAVVANAITGLPSVDRGTGRFEAWPPLVDHPQPTPPGTVESDSYSETIEGPGVGARIGISRRWRRRRIEHGDSIHNCSLRRDPRGTEPRGIGESVGLTR